MALKGLLYNTGAIFIAFLSVFYGDNLLRLAIAAISGVSGRLVYYGTLFTTNRAVWLDCDCVIITYLIPPVILALLGLFVYRNFRQRLVNGYSVSPFLFWIFLFAIARLLGGMIAGWLTHKGIWFAFSWAYIPSVVQLILSAIGLIALLYIGKSFRHYFFLMIGANARFVESRNITRFSLQAVFLPWFIAGILLSLYFDGHFEWYARIEYLSTIMFILPLVFSRKSLLQNSHLFDDHDKELVLSQWPFLIFAAVLIVGRIVLTGI